MEIEDLPKVSYEIAVEKGWWDDPRPLDDLLNLMVSEVSEALEDYRKGHEPKEYWFELKNSEGVVVRHSEFICPEAKPCGIPSELADIVIRVADLFGRNNQDFYEGLAWGTTFEGTFSKGLLGITRNIVRSPDTFDERAQACLRQAVRLTFAVAQAFDIDLWQMIEWKTAFNRTRTRKHGGKRI